LRIKIGCPETTANKVDGDCFWLVVDERQDRLRGLAIDELDAKNLGAREGGGDCDGEIRSLLGIFKFLDCLIKVSVRVAGAYRVCTTYHLLTENSGGLRSQYGEGKAWQANHSNVK
jgi:hypothetical protein